MSALREAAEAAAAYFAEQLSRQPHLTKATQIHGKLVKALAIRPSVPVLPVASIPDWEPGKFCPRCQTRKPFIGFSRQLSHRDGYQAICKLCAKAYQARRALRIAGRAAQETSAP